VQSGGEKAAANGVEVREISVVGAVLFVLFASTMLLLLFFFLNHVFAVVLVRRDLTYLLWLQVPRLSCL